MEIITFLIYFAYINETKGDYLVGIVLVSAICSTSDSAATYFTKLRK